LGPDLRPSLLTTPVGSGSRSCAARWTIDCKVTLEKKGERGVITIDAKFLHYKEF
jgi:cyanate lyase